MKPTMKLRFVERDVGGKYVERVRVLQQWWEDRNTIAYTGDRRDLIPVGEWRDVPLEKEKET